MKLRLPVFLDLLPARIDEAVGTRGWRRFRVARQRRLRQDTTASWPEARSEAGGPRPRLFIDMAVISKDDAGTGIQRVVRALALALRDAAPEQGWDIRFVSATRKRSYFEINWPDRLAGQSPDFTPIRAGPGDVFLGLDYSLDTLRWHRRKLARFRRQGGRLWFLVHDLLPLQRPEWFSRNTVLRYRIWLDMLAALAEGLVCNSGHTETELREVFDVRYGLTGGYRTQVVSMGGNILDATAPAAKPDAGIDAPRFDTTAPYFLMVGTLEPRKGHEDIVAAFEALWRDGGTQRLVLVGREGWQVSALAERIRSHPENGGRLLWLDDVGDRELAAIYDCCAGVIIASHAEGFGLPLVEALEHGKPVLARDLAVFRPHEGNGVDYFPADAATPALARAIGRWAEDVAAGRVVVTPSQATWALSAAELLSGLEQGG
ncbi:glycosyltransferase family 4 protein [Novosphingobium resinovorum]|uniref:Glycosyl transferase n=1 Tax=Novosphingobium resinovorum TaxID=158500 RepID=A0A1D8A5W2_9SPHN|nr:glycosyltransferase family 1 protein [Novosphingobium resinovorum]AOR77482.1 glycosyl transferase [Novosphingobium resinovorum]